MGSDRLSAKERAALFALMAEGRKLSNPELEERAGFRLDGKERRRLNDLNLVESDKPGRAYEHELTKMGWQWCADELSAGPDRRDTSLERALYVILGRLGRYLERSEQTLEDIFTDKPAAPPADMESRIKAGYRELAGKPGEFVKLSELRLKLPDVSSADLDSTLDRMYRRQRINLVAQANQEALSDADRESALLIGGAHKHLISIGQL
jgi:hypothetical protein